MKKHQLVKYMALQLLTSNDKFVKPYMPIDNTHKTSQLHFKVFIIYAS